MEMILIPKFNDVFPGEEVPELKDLLSDIPSAIVISTLGWINAEQHVNQLDFKIHLKILKALIEGSSSEIRDNIIFNIHELSNRHPNDVMTLFPIITSLMFIEHEILNYRKGEFGELTPEDEINILKAFLIFNQKLDEEHVDQIKSNMNPSSDQLPNENFYRALWPIFFKQYEHTLTNNLLIQAYLSFDFIKYLENNQKYAPFAKSYLKKVNATDYLEYIKKLLGFYIDSFKAGNKRFMARFSAEYLTNNNILKEFVNEPAKIDVDDYISNNKNVNFLGIREKPIIQFEDGYLVVSNWKYVIDKLFQAFTFDFYHNSGIKKTVRFNDYRSDIGNDFAHKNVFEIYLDNAFSSLNGVCLKDQNELINFDYYYRLENKIILIEFKNIILRFSEDFDEIKDDIDKKLIEEVHKGDIKKKAVIQLIDNIEKISNQFKDIDDFESQGIDKSRIIIYPVIIYTDKALVMPGINDYLAEKFVRLNSGKHHDFFMVRELVMIDFELFIDQYDLFCKGRLDLFKLIENYLQKLAILRTNSGFNRTTNARMNEFKTFEEVTSKITSRHDGFFESSLYQNLRKRLFPDKESDNNQQD